MKQHHKCMGCTYCIIGLHCMPWVALHGLHVLHNWAALHAMGCTAWDRTAWGCTAWGCTAWGCTAWGCIAWFAVYRLYAFFCLGGGAIPLRCACLIKLEFIMTVINADCRITSHNLVYCH